MATKKTPAKLFNAFTKSYKLRYVVHAAHRNDEKTLCGRDVVKIATSNTFDESVDGACKKCIQKIEIERRIHPGWE